MKTHFRTYNSLNANIFDLISGDNEVRQTQSLAYLLSKDQEVLNDLLNSNELQRIIGKVHLNSFDRIIVHSEMISSSNLRADIVIQLLKKNVPQFALIIEAKSAKTSVKSSEIIKQIERYLLPCEFPELDGFTTYGCSLTKNELIMNDPRITSISWNTIIKIVMNKSALSADFLGFLINIKGSMKFYEKEVFSIPSGRSNNYQYYYPYVYECPNEGTQYTSMKKPLFIAFRKKFGIMEKIFGVDEIIIMNPKTDFASFIANRAYSDDVKARVSYYCDQVWGKDKYDDNEKQFYILSLENQIDLPHHPRPRRNNAFRAYYKLSDILNQNKLIVKTDKD